ncbi:hypothetical protein ACFQO7_26565 [Catellatospora aurea]|uniref:WYL domain-containing protein n=1 Tax=Catellatospora aurea TaxID=1337874 RepID=A0ABW2H2G1_9ACTN
MARTRIGRAIGEVARRRNRGELTDPQASALTARLRDMQREAMYRTALDTDADPGHPVELRLIGGYADVVGLLTVLDEATTLIEVSDPFPTRRAWHVRVYATCVRRYPLSRGAR